MKRCLIVGGANGIGLSIAMELEKISECSHIYILDKTPLKKEFIRPKFQFFQFDLLNEN